jgi:dolichol-phosphate mannosyltransferase
MSSEPGLDVSVVLPTYNESASLPVLVPRIDAALREAGLNAEIIIVDDNSPDGTADVARELAKAHPVRVLKRTEERGLATAVLAGFALSEARVCVVMDADGSHPVSALPQMVRMILEDKAEIVVGSRHVPGGGSEDWPLFSQLKSRFAASLAIGLSGMTDPTTGFMAIRRDKLEGLALDPVGWKIVLEVVVKAHPARLAEVPIVFTDREHGESKQSLRVLGEYLTHLYKLYKFRFPGLIEFLKFCVVGFLGVFVDLSVVTALKELASLDTRLCQVGGFAAAVTFNYAVNRRFSFEHARETPLLFSYVTYVAANLAGLTLRMLAIQALMGLTTLDQGTGYGYLLLSAIGIVLATLVNFVGVKYVAFAPERVPTDLPEGDTAHVNDVSLGPSPLVATGFALAGTAIVALLLLALRPTWTSDEQVNLTMARNIVAGFEGFLHPSVTKGFADDWATEALPKLGNTPLYPAFLAWADSLGRLGLGLSAALLFAATLWGAFLALSPVDPGAARALVLLMAASPWLLFAHGHLEFEPLVAALSMLGFACIVRRDVSQPSRGLRPLGGFLLGLAFATKMWLVLPAALAAAVWLMSRAYATREHRAEVRRAIFATTTFAALGAGAHLAVVALEAPEDLGLWIGRVYFAIFSGHGVTGEKLSASAAPSAWAYVGFLFRDHGALLAPIVLGFPAATRRMGARRGALLAALLGAVFGLVPLSVPAYKEPLYMLPLLPFVYMFAGLCVVAPDRAPPRHRRINRAAARAAIAVVALLCFAWGVGMLMFPATRSIATLLHLAHALVWTLPAVFVLRERRAIDALTPAAALSLGLTLLGASLGMLA